MFSSSKAARIKRHHETKFSQWCKLSEISLRWLECAFLGPFENPTALEGKNEMPKEELECLIPIGRRVQIGANAGIVGMTKEHLGLALALNVPVFVVVTKVSRGRFPRLQRNLNLSSDSMTLRWTCARRTCCRTRCVCC